MSSSEELTEREMKLLKSAFKCSDTPLSVSHCPIYVPSLGLWISWSGCGGGGTTTTTTTSDDTARTVQ